MEHLKSGGIVVYLLISFEEMERRLRNITTRGLVLSRGGTLHEMYDERICLYEKYADITISGSHDNFEICLEKILEVLL